MSEPMPDAVPVQQDEQQDGEPARAAGSAEAADAGPLSGMGEPEPAGPRRSGVQPEPGVGEAPEPEPETGEAGDTGDEPEARPEPGVDDAPRPLGLHVEPTGHAPVDAQLRRLDDADHLAVSGHMEVYEDVHRGLRDALTALDRPAPAQGGPGHSSGHTPGHVSGPAQRPGHIPGRPAPAPEHPRS